MTAKQFLIANNPAVKIQLAWCPAGSCQITSPKSFLFETQGFWMSQFAVTQQLWFQVFSNWDHIFANQVGDEYPVETLSYEVCEVFCRRLTILLKELDVIPKTSSFRLPDTFEWEYACRANTSTKWFFGDDPEPLEEFAWFAKNSGRNLHPVGLKKPNLWGFYDMYGNVAEWCLQEQKDEFAICRGGDYTSIHEQCTSTSWFYSNIGNNYNDPLGFRLVYVE